jgi:hypothetical protein
MHCRSQIVRFVFEIVLLTSEIQALIGEGRNGSDNDLYGKNLEIASVIEKNSRFFR